MQEGVPDATLWLEAVAGTESSFAVLFDRHRGRVFRKAYARLRNVSDAEDIVAMVFLEAWRSRSKVRIVDGSLLPWLLVVTTNMTLNLERSIRRYRRLLAKIPPGEAEPDLADDVATAADSAQLAAVITTALQKLSQSDQKLVDLCLVDGLPLSTASSVLGLPIGTVKSRLHRARGKLQVSLAGFDLIFEEGGFRGQQQA